MAAEALLQSVPLSTVDPAAVVQYRRYLKARLLRHSRLYNPQNDAVCDMPFCLQPRGTHSPWTQCDQCDLWCHHNRCCNRVWFVSWEGFVCKLLFAQLGTAVGLWVGPLYPNDSSDSVYLCIVIMDLLC